MKNESLDANARRLDGYDALARVAHELRGPLVAILGWAAVLLRRDLHEEARRGLEIIARNANAQARLIDDLLDHAHIAHGKLRLTRERVDLVHLARSAAEAVRPLARDHGVELHVIESGPLEVDADPGRLRQVLNNLLSNAIRYCQRDQRDARVEIEIVREAHHAAIRVRDFGIGIAPDFLPHVFERFRREERSVVRGLGLGLAIVRHIVELHGGTITAESEGEGRGATFTVTLPRADDGVEIGASVA